MDNKQKYSILTQSAILELKKRVSGGNSMESERVSALESLIESQNDEIAFLRTNNSILEGIPEQISWHVLNSITKYSDNVDPIMERITTKMYDRLNDLFSKIDVCNSRLNDFSMVSSSKIVRNVKNEDKEKYLKLIQSKDDEILALKAKMSDKSIFNEQFNIENHNLREKNLALQKENDEFKKKIEALYNSNRDQENQRLLLSNSLLDLESKNAELRNENMAIKMKNSNTLNAIDDEKLSVSLKNLQTSYNMKLMNTENLLKAALNNNDDHLKEIHLLQERISELEKLKYTLESENTSLKEYISNISKSMNESNEKLKRQQGLYDVSKKHEKELEDEMSNVLSQNRVLSSKFNSIISSLCSMLGCTTSEDIFKRISDNISQIQELNKSVLSLKTLEFQLENEKELNSSLRSKLDETQAKLNREHEKNSSLLKGHQVDILQAMQNDYDSLNTMNQNMVKRFDQLTVKLRESESEKRKLQTQIDEIQFNNNTPNYGYLDIHINELQLFLENLSRSISSFFDPSEEVVKATSSIDQLIAMIKTKSADRSSLSMNWNHILVFIRSLFDKTPLSYIVSCVQDKANEILQKMASIMNDMLQKIREISAEIVYIKGKTQIRKTPNSFLKEQESPILPLKSSMKSRNITPTKASVHFTPRVRPFGVFPPNPRTPSE